jgi:hypothetical protein
VPRAESFAVAHDSTINDPSLRAIFVVQAA